MNPAFANDIAAVSRIDVVQNILEVVCRTTGLGFSAVARVTETHWIACAVRDEIAFGLTPGAELGLETTICNEIRQTGQIVAIDHVAEDKKFCNHHTPAKYGFQSYISVPINLPDGRFFGTLCAIDPRPARVNTPATIGMFKLFADLIAQHLDSQDRVTASEAALLTERETAQLREQFIAVLGHDLRNPLGAIDSAAQVLKMSVREDDRELVDMIRRSVNRMAGLINNVLDLTRGRLGGGLSVQLVNDASLAGVLNQVVTELQTSSPTRKIQREIDIMTTFPCDSARLGQMLSNLIANALTHGDPTSSVHVHAQTHAREFEMSVANSGATIPPEIIEKLFQPFARGSARPGQQGLGLGLYIASEIARAHHGSLNVISANGENIFTFRMPINFP